MEQPDLHSAINRVKQQPKTLIERLGFQDHDLRSPQHDEVMLWLDAAVKLPEVADLLAPPHAVTPEAALQQLAGDLQRDDRDFGSYTERHAAQVLLGAWDEWYPKLEAAPVPTTPASEHVRSTWELPITDASTTPGRSGWTHGFVDLAVVFKRGGRTLTWGPSRGDGGYGTPRAPHWETWHEQVVLYFEVKTHVDSLGELLRQVRFYEEKLRTDTYGAAPPFVVVSPDDRYAQQLVEQRVRFLRYPDAAYWRVTR